MEPIAKFTIEGRMVSLNEYVKACRSKKYVGWKMAEDQKSLVCWSIRSCKVSPIGSHLYPIRVAFLWVEPNHKRDLDNISFAKKFIFDALQEMRIIPQDNKKHIAGFTDDFAVDKLDPRIEVTIYPAN